MAARKNTEQVDIHFVNEHTKDTFQHGKQVWWEVRTPDGEEKEVLASCVHPRLGGGYWTESYNLKEPKK